MRSNCTSPGTTGPVLQAAAGRTRCSSAACPRSSSRRSAARTQAQTGSRAASALGHAQVTTRAPPLASPSWRHGCKRSDACGSSILGVQIWACELAMITPAHCAAWSRPLPACRPSRPRPARAPRRRPRAHLPAAAAAEERARGAAHAAVGRAEHAAAQAPARGRRVGAAAPQSAPPAARMARTRACRHDALLAANVVTARLHISSQGAHGAGFAAHMLRLQTHVHPMSLDISIQ